MRQGVSQFVTEECPSKTHPLASYSWREATSLDGKRGSGPPKPTCQGTVVVTAVSLTIHLGHQAAKAFQNLMCSENNPNFGNHQRFNRFRRSSTRVAGMSVQCRVRNPIPYLQEKIFQVMYQSAQYEHPTNFFVQIQYLPKM